MQTANAVPANAANPASVTPAALVHASVPQAMLAPPLLRSRTTPVILKPPLTVNINKEKEIFKESLLSCLACSLRGFQNSITM